MERILEKHIRIKSFPYLLRRKLVLWWSGLMVWWLWWPKLMMWWLWRPEW